ncbi:hypothetical protein Daura_49675 [Dactylosporangium aurantiacum]|uniref:Uncharacterized protein n=1 Tax=Dactylosporangium aurantiacum TaxID=35754 RepID=A0A9Q9IGT9_9ACTN|nr:hypothetical protein [Dactylosporangium aurantiacum]MDG6107453.1 hypothetical protein [Dactylosporangium aurantiacum]UWZ54423.1 hypothetical protein Daura_49675 [Dactylosporangium aurantiacum]
MDLPLTGTGFRQWCTDEAGGALRHGGGTVAGTIRDTTGAPVPAELRAVAALSGEPVAFAADVSQDGRSGRLGGTGLATAQTFRARNDRTTTVTETIPAG